jgi:hypothetical protein
MNTANVVYLAGTILAFLVFALTLVWVSRRK